MIWHFSEQIGIFTELKIYSLSILKILQILPESQMKMKVIGIRWGLYIKDVKRVHVDFMLSLHLFSRKTKLNTYASYCTEIRWLILVQWWIKVFREAMSLTHQPLKLYLRSANALRTRESTFGLACSKWQPTTRHDLTDAFTMGKRFLTWNATVWGSMPL